MNKENDGGRAFPRGSTMNINNEVITVSQTGMTLRQWYAGKALDGIDIAKVFEGTSFDDRVKSLATACFKIADAMIEEGNK